MGHHAAVSRCLDTELSPADGGGSSLTDSSGVFRLVSSTRTLSPGFPASQAGCPQPEEALLLPAPAPLGRPLWFVCTGSYSGSSSLGGAWPSLPAVWEMPRVFFFFLRK